MSPELAFQARVCSSPDGTGLSRRNSCDTVPRELSNIHRLVNHKPVHGVPTMAKCPNCKKPVVLNEKSAPTADSRPVQKEVVGKVKKEVMYSCPHCECVLGFGFFLGGVLTGRP
jgi:hypothetical protein